MHAVMITFNAIQSPEQVAQPFAEYAEALNSVPGLQTKTWIVSGQTFGGFHVFDDRQSADAYLSSELAQGLVATDGFSDFEISHFDILEDLSAKTGIVSRQALATG